MKVTHARNLGVLARARIVLALSAIPALSSAAAAPISNPAAYCKAKGGQVEVYEYVSSGGEFAKQARVCNFPDASGQDPDGHELVELSTLFTTKATLAALAYYGKPAWDGKRASGSPAKDYCLQLGAAATVRGVWKLDPASGEFGLCMFEDGSFMEEWTLFYNQAGIIRGVDLGTVMRFRNPTQR